MLMGFKEKMMDSIMGNLSSQEKSAMMDKMMGQFFDNLSPEEKRDMMKNMMPKMMGGGSMMDMMGSMGRGDEGSEGFNPMDMCQKMMANISKSSDLATFATPEIRGLFEDWVQQIEEELVIFIEENPATEPKQVADHFKISEESAVYFLSKLAQKGRISLMVQKKA
jgi:hypothetical protein